MSDAARVGAVVLIAVAMLVGLGQLVNGRWTLSGGTYYVLVRFDDGTGLSPGMTLKLGGTDAGWLEKVHLTTEPGVKQTAEAKIRVRRHVHLGDDARFEIGQESFIGEKELKVTPGDPARPQVKPGHVFVGSQGTDFSSLATQSAQIIARVDRLLSEESLGGSMRDLARGLSTSLGHVNDLLDKVGGVVEGSTGYVSASLKNMQATSQNFLEMSRNLNAASVSIGELANDPQYVSNIRGISSDLSSVGESLSHLSAQLDSLVSDPQAQQDAKDSLRLTKETLQEAKSALQRFQETLDRADGLIDNANGVMDDASGLMNDVGGAVGEARQKLDKLSAVGGAVKLKASMNVRAVDANRDKSLSAHDNYVGDINVAVGHKKAYVSAGADNIGEENDWNFLLGYGSLSGMSFRGGVYHDELGVGAACSFGGNGGVEVTAYDTKDPKLNAYGYIPVGDAVKVVVGVEDASHDAKATVGVGVDLK